MTAIAFRDVSFAYPDADRRVLDGVSLELDQGAFALVGGATGSGKSTLLRAINGLVPHFTGGSFAGRVLVHGRDTRAAPPRALADVVGFVPQDPDASFVLDRVEDELAYSLENLGTAPALMRRRVEETLDLLRIEPLRDRSVRALSGGERQRVAIAAALTAGPRVLVLDEPTSQLDPQGAEDVLAALQRLVDDLGLTVVAAEHRFERVAGFADVALGCIGDGSVTVGPTGEILERVGLGPPVARVGRALGWSPPPLTVRDARRLASTVHLDPPAGDGRPAPGDALLRARGLTARYGDRVALRAIDLELRRGEVVALMGRNGAGKTTLLRCLAGVHAPASGDVEASGRRPQPARDVALCPQAPDTVLFKDTVADEIGATLGALARKASVGSILEPLGIAGLESRHPRDLSAGERLLVALGAIAATGAPALLLDEPTRGLDVPSKDKLVAFLKAHAAAGNAAIIATHDVELAAEVADRVVMLAGGEVIADGEPAPLLGDSPVFAPQMARVFGPGWLTPGQVAAAVVS